MKKIISTIFLLMVGFIVNGQIDKDSLLSKLEEEFSSTDTLSALDSDSLIIVSYSNKDNAEIFLLGFYKKDGTLSYYSEGIDTRFYREKGLSFAKWYNEELIAYSYFGQGLTFTSWKKFPDGSTEYFDRDSLGFGTVSVLALDGSLLKFVKIEQNISNVKTYYASGKLKEEYSELYFGKAKIGDYVCYDENGKIMIEGRFLDRQELIKFGYEIFNIFEGIKNGQWRYYKDSELVKVEIWENGELVIE